MSYIRPMGDTPDVQSQLDATKKAAEISGAMLATIFGVGIVALVLLSGDGRSRRRK